MTKKELAEYSERVKKFRKSVLEKGEAKRILLATGFYTKSGKLKSQFVIGKHAD